MYGFITGLSVSLIIVLVALQTYAPEALDNVIALLVSLV